MNIHKIYQDNYKAVQTGTQLKACFVKIMFHHFYISSSKQSVNQCMVLVCWLGILVRDMESPRVSSGCADGFVKVNCNSAVSRHAHRHVGIPVNCSKRRSL